MIDLRCLLDLISSRARLASWWWTRCGQCDEIMHPQYLIIEGPQKIDIMFRGHAHFDDPIEITIGAPA